MLSPPSWRWVSLLKSEPRLGARICWPRKDGEVKAGDAAAVVTRVTRSGSFRRRIFAGVCRVSDVRFKEHWNSKSKAMQWSCRILDRM